MAWKLHPNRQVRAAVYQQLRHRQPSIVKLRDRMEDRRLAADAGFIRRRPRVHLRAAFHKQFCRFQVAELRGHVQQCRSLEKQTPAAGAAAVEFREPPPH